MMSLKVPTKHTIFKAVQKSFFSSFSSDWAPMPEMLLVSTNIVLPVYDNSAGVFFSSGALGI
jgi:hypothetical protein